MVRGPARLILDGREIPVESIEMNYEIETPHVEIPMGWKDFKITRSGTMRIDAVTFGKDWFEGFDRPIPVRYERDVPVAPSPRWVILPEWE